jgi:hypothetical protein
MTGVKFKGLICCFNFGCIIFPVVTWLKDPQVKIINLPMNSYMQVVNIYTSSRTVISGRMPTLPG